MDPTSAVLLGVLTDDDSRRDPDPLVDDRAADPGAAPHVDADIFTGYRQTMTDAEDFSEIELGRAELRIAP